MRPEPFRTGTPRWRAGHYLATMVVCFGLTVVLTRTYLVLTGYPKIGGHTFHIAHALFGGLFLVIACLLPLLYSNQGALTACAVLSGIGAGLFIDEVGKFITQNNDYFFPLAAPIIYFAFLLIVYLARYARREQASGPYALMAQVLEGLQPLITGRLSPAEHAELRAQLGAVQQAGPRPDLADLATVVEHYLQTHPPTPSADRPGWQVRTQEVFLRAEARLLPRRALRVFLATVLGAHAAWSLVRLALTVAVLGGWHTSLHPVDRLLDTSGVHGWKSLLSWLLAAGGEVVTGLLYAYAAGALARGREVAGVRFGVLATGLSLTVVNVLSSYFHQFLTVPAALLEGVLLVLLLRYRARFLLPAPQPEHEPALPEAL